MQLRERNSTSKDADNPAAAAPVATLGSASRMWLDAHFDILAGVKAFSSCLHTCDLYGDGDWRLAVAGLDKKLKIWKGTHMVLEQALLDVPCAMESFYADTQHPKVPNLAVAVGANVFIYRNMRPYFKFTLPPENVSDVEKAMWQQLYAGSQSTAQAKQTLQKLSGASDIQLSICAMDILSMEDADREAELQELSQQFKGDPPVQQTVITCMTTIKRAYDEEDAVSCLVLGTESSQVLVLNTAANAVTATWPLKHVPAFLCASGLLDVEPRLAVATRYGKVLLMRSGMVTTTINLDGLPLGIARSHKGFLIGCTNSTVQCYSLKGKRTFCINLPAPILAMHGLETAQQRIIKCLLLSLSNGEVRMYNEQRLVSITQFSSPVNAMTFGKFGREDSTLISVTCKGGLDVKILPRTAKLDGTGAATRPPPEQDIPLDIPKRTAAYIAQTEREKANAVDMHTTFQQALVKLRLTTARAYFKVLTDGQGATSTSSASSASLSLNATVSGLGPAFKLTLELTNNADQPIRDAALVLLYNRQMYKAENDQVQLPALLTAMQYHFDIRIRCLDPEAGVDAVKVLLHSKQISVPLLSALIKMPLSELEEE